MEPYWENKEHRLAIYHGNCVEVMPQLEHKFDLCLTDPPYDLSEEGKHGIHNKLLEVAEGSIVFSPPENQWLPADQYGFWVKPISTKNTSRRYSRFVEMIFFYGNLGWNTDRHWSQYTNVFTDLVDGETNHPYEKPTSLIRRLILNHTNAGDSIIDPFLGGGTILFEAHRIGRCGVGIETSEEYCHLAAERLDEEIE